MGIETENPLGAMTLEQRVGVLKALADQSRAQLVNALLEKPHCVEELAERLHLAPSTISFHLRRLEEANLVTKTKTQYYLVYHLRADILQMRLRDFVSMPSGEDGAEHKRMKKHRQKVVATFFRGGELTALPKQWRKRRLILEEFLAKFETGRDYEEHEVNQRIETLYSDYCTIRRLLIDEGYMAREGQRYRRVEMEIQPMENRSELKRQYKETPKQAGIFLVTNTSNGKVLLGSSLNLHGPLNKHRFMLSIGYHWLKPLQEDWNQSGPDCFKFEILEVIKPKDEPDFDIEEELSLLEQIWLEKLQPVGKQGYNKDTKIRE
jgi:hypothetical protein